MATAAAVFEAVETIAGLNESILQLIDDLLLLLGRVGHGGDSLALLAHLATQIKEPQVLNGGRIVGRRGVFAGPLHDLVVLDAVMGFTVGNWLTRLLADEMARDAIGYFAVANNAAIHTHCTNDDSSRALVRR